MGGETISNCDMSKLGRLSYESIDDLSCAAVKLLPFECGGDDDWKPGESGDRTCGGDDVDDTLCLPVP